MSGVRSRASKTAGQTAIAVLAIGGALGGGAATAQDTTQRVSVSSLGVEAELESGIPAISADARYVAFQSPADNLVAGDTNSAHDVFVHDRVTGVTERVSVNDDEEEGDANSGFVFGPAGSQRLAISDDGRFVAFASQATNLVEGDTNESIDVFVRDRQAGTTERVSVAAGGIEANSFSGSASLSADGRSVAFESGATNLVAGEVDGNGVEDIFVRDRQADTTERVSISDGEQEGDAASQVTAISADGRFVAFKSDATNLTAGVDANGAADIFVRDRTGGTTERVSVNSDEEEGDDDCGGFDISSDGRIVVFACQATNLVAGDDNGVQDVFVRDRVDGTTELVNVASGGGVADGASGASFSLSISGDGRSVAFASDATDLVSGDTNGETDVFVRDLVASSTERVSIAEDGSQANDWSSFATAIDDSGLVTAFGSAATNLVQGDTNRAVDVFVRTTTRDFGTEYVAKLVCGQQTDPDDMRLARGFYATTINVHNPNRENVRFFKKLALTIPPGDQQRGRIHPIAEDALAYDEALAVDCVDISRRVFDGSLPARYIEGFVVIQSTHSLDVTAVYTTAGIDERGNATLHSSIDVEQVSERDIAKKADLSIEKSAHIDYVTGIITFLTYTIEVTNNGDLDAPNVVVTDHLELEIPTIGVNEGSFMSTHQGTWTLIDATNTTADLRAEIPLLPASETATLSFSVATVFDAVGAVELTDTASVESDLADPNPTNDSVEVVTPIP